MATSGAQGLAAIADAAAAPLRSDDGNPPGLFGHRDDRWFSAGVGRREAQRRSFSFLRFAAAALQQSASDPLTNDLKLFFRKRILVRRHRRFFVVRHHLIQATARSIAGGNLFAATATFHQSTIGVDRQSTLGIVRVMALQAVLAKDRQDVIGEVDRGVSAVFFSAGACSPRTAAEQTSNKPKVRIVRNIMSILWRIEPANRSVGEARKLRLLCQFPGQRTARVNLTPPLSAAGKCFG